MICDNCGKKMIQRYSNIVLDTNPPQYPWYWWCGCGAEKPGGVKVGRTEEQTAYERWKYENEVN